MAAPLSEGSCTCEWYPLSVCVSVCVCVCGCECARIWKRVISSHSGATFSVCKRSWRCKTSRFSQWISLSLPHSLSFALSFAHTHTHTHTHTHVLARFLKTWKKRLIEWATRRHFLAMNRTDDGKCCFLECQCTSGGDDALWLGCIHSLHSPGSKQKGRRNQRCLSRMATDPEKLESPQGWRT